MIILQISKNYIIDCFHFTKFSIFLIQVLFYSQFQKAAKIDGF